MHARALEAQQRIDVLNNALAEAVKAGDLVRARLDAGLAECERLSTLAHSTPTDYAICAIREDTAKKVASALRGEVAQ